MRTTTPSPRGAWRRLVWPASAAALVLLLLLAWFLSGPPAPDAPLPPLPSPSPLMPHSRQNQITDCP